MNRRHLHGSVPALPIAGLLPRLHLAEQRQADLNDLERHFDFAMNPFGVG